MNLTKRFLSDFVNEMNPVFLRNNLIVSRIGSGKTELAKRMIENDRIEGETLFVTLETELQYHDKKNQELKENNLNPYKVISYKELELRLKDDLNYFDKYNNLFFDEILTFLYDENVFLNKHIFKSYPNKKLFYLSQKYDLFNNLLRESIVRNKSGAFAVSTFDYSSYSKFLNK